MTTNAQKSIEILEYKKYWRLSRTICSELCIIMSRCFRKLQVYMSKNILS